MARTAPGSARRRAAGAPVAHVLVVVQAARAASSGSTSRASASHCSACAMRGPGRDCGAAGQAQRLERLGLPRSARRAGRSPRRPQPPAGGVAPAGPRCRRHGAHPGSPITPARRRGLLGEHADAPRRAIWPSRGSACPPGPGRTDGCSASSTRSAVPGEGRDRVQLPAHPGQVGQTQVPHRVRGEPWHLRRPPRSGGPPSTRSTRSAARRGCAATPTGTTALAPG